MTATPKRRWYQFSLKTLFVLITALCIGPGGYLVYERRKAAREKEAVEEIWSSNGKVYGDKFQTTRSPIMLALFGDDSYGNINGVEFDSPRITDADLVKIESFPNIKELYLPKTRVTGAGVATIVRLTELEELDLFGTLVTDASLALIQTLTQLKELNLNGTQVTDSGLEHLSELTNLESLWLNGTQVTDDGVAKLQKELPNCRIFH